MNSSYQQLKNLVAFNISSIFAILNSSFFQGLSSNTSTSGFGQQLSPTGVDVQGSIPVSSSVFGIKSESIREAFKVFDSVTQIASDVTRTLTYAALVFVYWQ